MTEKRQVSTLERCLFYRESKKMTEERQRLSLGVHFKKVSVL